MLFAGFDYGNKLGHACHDGKTIVFAGLLDLGKCKTKGVKALRLYDFLCDIPHYRHADAFAHEQILMIRLPHIRPATTANQAAIDMIVQMVMDGRPCYPVQGRQLKRFATGSHNADKQLMLRYAQMEYPSIHVDDENQADAMHLAAFAAAEFKRERIHRCGIG